jgi:hypothetical protein
MRTRALCTVTAGTDYFAVMPKVTAASCEARLALNLRRTRVAANGFEAQINR